MVQLALWKVGDRHCGSADDTWVTSGRGGGRLGGWVTSGGEWIDVIGRALEWDLV